MRPPDPTTEAAAPVIGRAGIGAAGFDSARLTVVEVLDGGPLEALRRWTALDDGEQPLAVVSVETDDGVRQPTPARGTTRHARGRGGTPPSALGRPPGPFRTKAEVGDMVVVLLLGVVALVVGGCACVVWAERGGPRWARVVAAVTLAMGRCWNTPGRTDVRARTGASATEATKTGAGGRRPGCPVALPRCPARPQRRRNGRQNAALRRVQSRPGFVHENGQRFGRRSTVFAWRDVRELRQH